MIGPSEWSQISVEEVITKTLEPQLIVAAPNESTGYDEGNATTKVKLLCPLL